MASCSGSGSGDGGSTKSKKPKQKKVPQRGLGVAQLERIREEEQKKREKGETGSSFSESNSSVQGPNIRPGLVAVSSNHLPSIPNFANLHRSSGQNSKQFGEIGYNVDGDKREFTFLPQVNLPREALNFHTLPHRSHILQYSPNTMVNTTSGFLAALPSTQMEPPSNQMFRDDNYTYCSEADKMVIGVKRSYPFSLETIPVSSSHSNFPTYASSRSRLDDVASFINGYAPQMELRNKYKREVPSNSIFTRESERDPTEAIRDNEILSGEFLTLAPPAAVSSPSSLKYSISQEQSRNQIHRMGSGESTEQPFCFFPEKLETDQNNSKAEKSASIDLNLKL